MINCMSAGMDVSKIVTKKIRLDQVGENLVMLQKDRDEVKITVTHFE